jgi:unsaturated pyranuronate lyase
MTFAHFDFAAAGARIHEHCHSNEEVWTVIEGELEVTVGGDAIIAKAGCVAIVPPNMAHSVRAITDGKATVADCPVRIDASGGRRGVIRVDFNRPFALPENPGSVPIRIPLRLFNWGKGRALVKGVEIESRIAPALPPSKMTEVAQGDLPTHCTIEADEARAETVACEGFDAEQRDQILSGAAVLYVRGVIVYDDDFGSRWHRTFCCVYDRTAFDGEGGFVPPNQPGYNYGS